MARATFSRSSGRTISGWFKTRDTVAGETAASRATSSILTLPFRRPLTGVVEFLSIPRARIDPLLSSR